MVRMKRVEPHFERALFVLGNPNAGKSRLLRSMFIDPRFGLGGQVPTASIIKTISLSKERCLAVRCTSPHEMNETPEIFFQKIDRTMRNASSKSSRFNLACALQPMAAKRMPNVVTICGLFRQR